MRRSLLPTLSDAIDWLRDAWDDRDAPTRLHLREHEGWGLYFAPAFARHLDATPDDQTWATETRTCRHPRLTTRDVWQCPDCSGTGTYETTALVWRYPTWRAMRKLERTNRRAWDVVLTLVINEYSPQAMAHLGVGEGALLAAIRRLFACYERAPSPKVGWVDKSESQRMAEGVVA